MIVKKIFKSIPVQKEKDDEHLKDVLKIIKITDPRKVLISATRLRELADYVQNNNIDLRDFQYFILRILKAPGLIGDMDYI